MGYFDNTILSTIAVAIFAGLATQLPTDSHSKGLRVFASATAHDRMQTFTHFWEDVSSPRARISVVYAQCMHN